MKVIDIFTKYAKLLSLDKKSFPGRPFRLKAFIFLRLIDFWLTFTRKDFFGPFGRKIDPFVLSSWKLFAKYNPFHFGEYLKDDIYYGLDYFEYQTTRKILNLYKADHSEVACILLSSATEGNLYSMWMGRESFYQKKINSVFVLTTDLTDQSVINSSELLNIPMLKIGLDDQFGMSVPSLEHLVTNFGKNGKLVGLIVCLTLGYKKTGTSDNRTQIIWALNSLSRKYPNVKLFVFIDAASEGLTRPVMENFNPFKDLQIMSVVFDTHKLFFTPYTTGVILYRKKIIPKESKFSFGILESRSSIPGVALWAFIQGQGISGIRKIVNNSHSSRKYFVEKVEQFIKPLNEFLPRTSLSLTLELHKKDFETFEQLKPYFSIICHDIVLENHHRYLVKVYFFPDTNKREIDILFRHWKRLVKVNE